MTERATAIFNQRQDTMILSYCGEGLEMPLDEALSLAQAMFEALRGPALARRLSKLCACGEPATGVIAAAYEAGERRVCARCAGAAPPASDPLAHPHL